MPEGKLLAAIAPYNTHWESGEASRLVRKHPTARRSFGHIRQCIDNLPFEVLAGPRQVGKTTLAGNLIDDLLGRGVDPRRIVFVPCDLPAIELETGGQAQPLIDLMERDILREKLGDQDGLCYLFLDEVHELADWSRQLKALYDTYHPWLRVFATGSSSASLLSPPTADLPGRVRRSQIFPLKFSEAVHALVPTFSDGDHAAYDEARAVRHALKLPLDDDGIRKLRDALDALHATLRPHATELIIVFKRYLTRGGFPAALLADSDEEAHLFHEQTIDLTLSRDLTRFSTVRKAQVYPQFLAQMARQHAGRFVATNVAQALGLDRGTVLDWKRIAEALFLIQQLPALNASFNPSPAKSDKAYIVDPGIRSYLAAERDIATLESSGRIGFVVEGVVQDHLRRLQFNLFSRRQNRLGYLPSPEVDFVAETPGGWLAIEAKYTDEPSAAVRALERVSIDQENVLKIVLSRDEYDVSGPVWVLPVWLFCLVC